MAKSTSHVRATSRARAQKKRDILYPLDVAYAQAAIPQPKVREISPRDIPSPYRSLLVHENDLTLTLERHFGGPVRLRTLSTVLEGGWYLRRVLLVQAYSGRPVAMGAIRLRLAAFKPRLRTLILKNEMPFGRLMRDAGIEFKSQPRIFLEIEPNPEMMGVFWMREPRMLYGRQTEAYLGGSKVGDIIEVLPLV